MPGTNLLNHLSTLTLYIRELTLILQYRIDLERDNNNDKSEIDVSFVAHSVFFSLESERKFISVYLILQFYFKNRKTTFNFSLVRLNGS